MAADPRLLERIAREGPLDVAAVLEAAGAGGAGAYYERAAVVGAAGDFVTAPEISQCFGELIGLVLAEAWRTQGAPDPVVLAEAGPGSGALMADLWRAVAVVPGFHAAARLHLVERSERLRARQQAALAGAAAPVFLADLADLPRAPLLLVANEFLDALPAHQLVRRGAGWAERRIGVADAHPVWVETAAPAPLAAAAEGRFPAAAEGAIAEVAPARGAAVATIAERVAAAGGLALVVDYGGIAAAPVDTLQAVRRHARVDPLAHLGAADLTVAVDFGPLVDAVAAAGAVAYGPLPQATFLRELGIEMRALALAHGRRGGEREAVLAGVHRLIDPRAMGEAFKVLAIAPANAPAPAGFSTARAVGGDAA